jgi:hypothetical protein
LIEGSQVTKSKQLIDQGSAKGQLSLKPVENLFDLFEDIFRKKNYDKKLEIFQYNNKTDAKTLLVMGNECQMAFRIGV